MRVALEMCIFRPGNRSTTFSLTDFFCVYDQYKPMSKWHFRSIKNEMKTALQYGAGLLTIRRLNWTFLLYFQLPMLPNGGPHFIPYPQICSITGGAHRWNIDWPKRNMEVCVKPEFQQEMCSEPMYYILWLAMKMDCRMSSFLTVILDLLNILTHGATVVKLIWGSEKVFCCLNSHVKNYFIGTVSSY